MNHRSFLTVCLNPTLQKTLVFSKLITDEVNRTTEYRFDVAGKGLNANRVLTQLGEECVHLTHLGGDLRPLFLELCAIDKLKVEWVENRSSIRFCYTLINKENREVTELVENGELVGEGTEERLIGAFSTLINDRSMLIISGSKPAGFSGSLVSGMVRKAKDAGRKVVLDLRGGDLVQSLPWKPDVIKPNLAEFLSTFAPELADMKINSRNDGMIKKKTQGICEELYEKYGCMIVLTRGSSQVWYAEKGIIEEFSVEPVEPLNTAGSGDAFTAGLAAALESGASLQEAVDLGSWCGKRNALLIKPGTIEP
jgi:1-phosphofructokinase/tagatose 6-phosphate kinase